MRALAVAATAALSLLGAAVPPPARHAAAAPSDAPPAAARAAEVRRIRAHFDSVLAELPRDGAAALAPAPRARRRALLDTLRAYRDRGEFPHNYDFPGRAVPYFVDRGTGTLCAVAHLMAASGRRDVVDRVARADNNVRVPALAGDTAFTGWLAASGLTLAEAARIQVPYVGDPAPAPAPAAGVRAPSSAAASTAALGGAMLAAAWNASANPRGANRVGNVLGLAAGAAAVGVGAASTGAPGARPALGVANLAVGAASVWLGARGVRRHRADLAAARSREASLARRASVMPLLPPAGTGGGAGAMVAMRF